MPPRLRPSTPHAKVRKHTRSKVDSPPLSQGLPDKRRKPPTAPDLLRWDDLYDPREGGFPEEAAGTEPNAAPAAAPAAAPPPVDAFDGGGDDNDYEAPKARLTISMKPSTNMIKRIVQRQTPYCGPVEKRRRPVRERPQDFDAEYETESAKKKRKQQEERNYGRRNAAAQRGEPSSGSSSSSSTDPKKSKRNKKGKEKSTSSDTPTRTSSLTTTTDMPPFPRVRTTNIYAQRPRTTRTENSGPIAQTAGRSGQNDVRNIRANVFLR